MKRAVLGGLSLALCMTGCGDRTDKVPPATGRSASPAATPRPQPPPPAINTEETLSLFARISDTQVGDKMGRVEMRPHGILIHPGATTATRVRFRLGRTIKALTLAGFIIGPLPKEAQAIAQAGTVSVRLEADGRVLDTVAIDRYSQYIKRIELDGVDVLTVTVANGDGQMWWDWFTLGVQARE
jgi:hypothetical protein